MSKRDDEEFARETFTRFLTRTGSLPPTWQDGTEPPDYFLSWHDARYAVEVTQVMESFDLGARPLSYQGMARALRSLTRRIQSRALAAGVLHGTYVLDLAPIPNLADQEPQLTEAVLRLLDSQPGPGRDTWTPVLMGADGPIVGIMKLLDTGASIGELIGGAGPKWGGQIVQETSGLILAALTAKTERMKAVPGAHIILLIDAYHYGPGEIWQATVAGAPSLCARFHTIARIHGNYECQILWSSESSWKAAA